MRKPIAPTDSRWNWCMVHKVMCRCNLVICTFFFLLTACARNNLPSSESNDEGFVGFRFMSEDDYTHFKADAKIVQDAFFATLTKSSDKNELEAIAEFQSLSAKQKKCCDIVKRSIRFPLYVSHFAFFSYKTESVSPNEGKDRRHKGLADVVGKNGKQFSDVRRFFWNDFRINHVRKDYGQIVENLSLYILLLESVLISSVEDCGSICGSLIEVLDFCRLIVHECPHNLHPKLRDIHARCSELLRYCYRGIIFEAKNAMFFYLLQMRDANEMRDENEKSEANQDRAALLHFVDIIKSDHAFDLERGPTPSEIALANEDYDAANSRARRYMILISGYRVSHSAIFRKINDVAKCLSNDCGCPRSLDDVESVGLEGCPQMF